MNKNIKLPQLKNIVVLRSFAIIAVVMYHCFCPWLYAWNWYECDYRPLYSFIFETVLVGRMPLFVCVSGYLFSHLFNDRGKYQNFKEFIINKIKRLLIPCIIFTGLMCLILQINYIENLIGYGFHLWFLKMLFWCFITTWILARYIKKTWIECLILTLSIAIMFINGPIFLGIGQFFKYYFFFLGGYLFYRYQKQLSFIYLKRNATVLISLYALVCIICGIRYITQPELSYLNIIHVDHIIELSRMILRILMILIAFIIVDYYLKNKNTISHIFDSLNKLSYGIYLFHMLYLQIIHTYIFDYTIPIAENFGFISPIILFIIILSLSIYSTYIIRKSKWGIYLIG